MTLKSSERPMSVDQNIDGENIRTTVAIPAAVDWNLTVWCAQKNIKKNQAIIHILSTFLAGEGLQPDKPPREITVSY